MLRSIHKHKPQFALRVLSIILICVSLSAMAQTHQISSNGVYRSNIKLKHSRLYWEYLKFVNDSIVISVSTTGNIKEIKDWFHQGHDGVSVGKYSIVADSIFFYTTYATSSVLYRGKIIKNRLNLLWENPRLQRAGRTIYYFKKGILQ